MAWDILLTRLFSFEWTTAGIFPLKIKTRLIVNVEKFPRRFILLRYLSPSMMSSVCVSVPVGKHGTGWMFCLFSVASFCLGHRTRSVTRRFSCNDKRATNMGFAWFIWVLIIENWSGLYGGEIQVHTVQWYS